KRDRHPGVEQRRRWRPDPSRLPLGIKTDKSRRRNTTMTYTLRPLGVLAVLCAVSLAQAESVRKGPWPLAKTEGPKVEILAYDNGDVSPWIEFFTFDSPKHPKIVQLRTEYKLDELVKHA